MASESEYTRYLATLKAVGDSLRADILRLLARDSFGVLELAHMLDISQPALSHHLKILTTAGLLTTRRDGNSIFYRRCAGDASTSYRGAVLDALDSFPLDAKLGARRDDIHRERAARSRTFFRDNARAFHEQRALICAPDVYLPALAALLPERGRQAIDVGPGDGEALALLSPRFERVHGIDNSAEMLARARQCIDDERLPNITLRDAEFTAVKRPRADFVLMAMVLHHAPCRRRSLRTQQSCCCQRAGSSSSS
ncbi:MAG: metalloregulator ArsR/SmtB family transcription factor [Gammaproteobacteria bacterium]|nr:metalloregulator ArsR/SmtB family transcription factor [Gammaproteobacteria bacterium]